MCKSAKASRRSRMGTAYLVTFLLTAGACSEVRDSELESEDGSAEFDDKGLRCAGTGAPGACEGGSDFVPRQSRLLGRSSDTKVRIVSWNVFRGSVFPATAGAWAYVNTSARKRVQEQRRAGAVRVLRALDPDVLLLQETIYGGPGPRPEFNASIAEYLNAATGAAWSVDCNGQGLCTAVRRDRGLSMAASWKPHQRTTGHRVRLPNGTTLLVLNVHYVSDGQERHTIQIIEGEAKAGETVVVGGDFNNTPAGTRTRNVDAVSGLDRVVISQFKDPRATHLTGALASRVLANTKGYATYARSILSDVSGGEIDHFFVRSRALPQKRFILNTLLLSPVSLAAERLQPLDVALEPDRYTARFANFVTTGVVGPEPTTNALDRIDLDHLPLVLDLSM